MSGSLITLPWRVGARGAGLAIRTAGGIVHLAGDVAGLAGASVRRGSAGQDDVGAAPSPADSSSSAPSPADSSSAVPSPADSSSAAPSPDASSAATATSGAIAAPEPTAPPEPPPAPGPPKEFEPSHVSEERELVEEVAEPGAEDGAGAQVTIAEPWDGYRLMNAGAVIDRLPGLTTAELAAVELYELGHRGRQTLLTAARRELKQRS